MLYSEIDLIAKNLENQFSAAETHGIATGMLCGNENTETGTWLGEILQVVDEINLEDRIVLERLFENTKTALLGEEFSYQLLLPDEAIPLNEQADALRQWCQGFLFGIGSVPLTEDWPDESREIIKDIAEFTKLDTDADGEDAENDFMEITEYLRAAVMYLRTELNPG